MARKDIDYEADRARCRELAVHDMTTAAIASRVGRSVTVVSRWLHGDGFRWEGSPQYGRWKAPPKTQPKPEEEKK